jgi:hypothetical protein
VEAAPQLKAKGGKKYLSEPVFKWIVIINLAIIAFCLPSFYQFRLDAIAADLPVISVHSLKWCLAGFLLMVCCCPLSC